MPPGKSTTKERRKNHKEILQQERREKRESEGEESVWRRSHIKDTQGGIKFGVKKLNLMSLTIFDKWRK